MAKKLFVFDLDDTLIDNVHDYAEPILEMAGYIVRHLGSKAPHVYKIIGIEEEIDAKRVKEINPDTGRPFGYSMERFPGTCVETYREIARRSGVMTDIICEIELERIGMKAFVTERYSANVKKNAKKTLDFLKFRGDELMLLTKGDTRVQVNKTEALRQSGIDVFSKIRITDGKDRKEFLVLAGRFKGKKYSVGNSYDSDIVPAFEAGFKGIYIPAETWETLGKLPAILSKVDNDRCYVLDSLESLISQYGGLE